MKTNKVKMLVQAGLFVAIYTIFFLLSKYTNMGLENLLYFILPLPLILFTVNYSFKYALIPFVASICIGLVINPLSALFYLLPSNILAVIYGELVRRNKPNKYLIWISIIVEFVINLFTCLIFAKLFNYSLNDEILEIFKFLFKILRVDLPSDFIMNRAIIASIPVYLILLGCVQGYMCHFAATILLKKLKIRDSGIANLYLINISKTAAIFYCFLLIGHVATINLMYTTENQFLLILCYIITDLYWFFVLMFALQFIISMLLWTSKKGKLRYLYLLEIILLCIFPLPVLILYSIIGVIFVFTDFSYHLLYNNK